MPANIQNEPPPFPHRHRAWAEAQQRLRKRRLLLGRQCALPEARWQQIGHGLTTGDSTADAVADWLEHQPSGHAVAMQAIQHGLHSLSSSQRQQAPALCHWLQQAEQRPAWVNDQLLQQGSRFMDRCHPVSYYVLRDAALMPGYMTQDLNKPLLMTGALRGGTSRRVAQTMKWTADCCTRDGLQTGAPGFVSTLHVRLLHARIRQQLKQRPDWDSAELGLPINQTDMAITWLAFSAVLLLGVRAMGVPVSKSDAHAVMHLWQYACWLMGVDESWLTDDEQQGRLLVFQMLSTFRGPDDSTAALGRALMEEVPQIPYPHMRPLMWRWEQAKHLSVTRLLVGRRGMHKLGLPGWVPPWYPLASMPWNLSKHLLLKVAPETVNQRLEQRGQLARDALVQLHFGIQTPDLADFKAPT